MKVAHPELLIIEGLGFRFSRYPRSICSPASMSAHKWAPGHLRHSSPSVRNKMLCIFLIGYHPTRCAGCGGRSAILVEPLVVVRKYQVHWIRPKPDLVKLAKLRRKGWSLREISAALGIPKTTLFGLLKKVEAWHEFFIARWNNRCCGCTFERVGARELGLERSGLYASACDDWDKEAMGMSVDF